MDTQVLGVRLAAYRDNIGFTLQQVAKITRLPTSTINDYEMGKIERPDVNKLERLCRVYGVSVSVLMAAIEPQPTIHFRLNSFEVSAGQKRKIEHLMEFVRDYQNILDLLESEVNISLHRTYPNDPTINWFDLGETIAASERKLWSHDITDPIDLLPLLQKEGILVNSVELPESIDGFFCMSDNGRTFWIFINSKKPAARRNFTLAHEYAHFLLDRNERNYICNIDKTEADPLERRANAVAARLLVPSPALESMVTRRKVTPDDVISLCRIFGVSNEVINYRLKDERLVSRRKSDELFGYDYTSDGRYQLHQESMKERFNLPKLDPSFSSPNSIQDEFFVKVKAAYEKGKITFSRALSYFRSEKTAELFGLSPKEPEGLEHVF